MGDKYAIGLWDIQDLSGHQWSSYGDTIRSGDGIRVNITKVTGNFVNRVIHHHSVLGRVAVQGAYTREGACGRDG